MTLQERMIAVYLRQANLPPEEKGKLRLFLGLLLETMQEDETTEQSRAEQSRAEQSRRRRPLPLARNRLGLQAAHPQAAVEKKRRKDQLTL